MTWTPVTGSGHHRKSTTSTQRAPRPPPPASRRKASSRKRARSRAPGLVWRLSEGAGGVSRHQRQWPSV